MRCWLVSSSQYTTEDDDDEDDDQFTEVYNGVDLLNFFIAMTLLSGEDDDDDDDFDFPFYLTEEFGYWAFVFVSAWNHWMESWLSIIGRRATSDYILTHLSSLYQYWKNFE